jgi:molybdopterin-binding protein
MKISARNQLRGIVKKVNQGSVNTEVVIELAPGVEITSIITKTSAEDLEIAVGKQVYAVVKASHVMVGVDH